MRGERLTTCVTQQVQYFAVRFDVLIEFPARRECKLTALVHVAELLKLFAMNLAFVIFQVERIGINLSTLVANQLGLGLVRQFVLVQSPSRVAYLSTLVTCGVNLLACYTLIDMGLQLFEAAELAFARHANIVAWIR